MSSNQSKRTAVEQIVANAQAKVSWGRAVARANAGLAGKPAAAPQAHERPKAGWAKVIAKLNGRGGQPGSATGVAARR